MGSISVSVVIPVYNEQKVVEKVIDCVKQVTSSLKEVVEIITINDGSSDNTKEILDKISGISVINSPYNQGYGASLKKGLTSAKGTHILIIDADGTYPVESIPEIIKCAHSYDMVIGSRTGKDVHVPWLRKPAKWFIGKLANFLAQKKIPDLNSGLRIFKKEIAFKFFHLFPARFSFTTTITLAFLTNDFTVKFLPINYYKRKGNSTIRPVKDFIGFINLIIRIITYFNPFKIFFTISIILLILSILIFLYTFFVVGRIMDITVVMMFLASLQIFLFGLIADLIVKSRK